MRDLRARAYLGGSMSRRYKMSRGRSRRSFSRGAGRLHVKNMATMARRGGNRI